MKKVICDHAGEVPECSDKGDGKPCQHSTAYFPKRHCIPWLCYDLGHHVLVRCVEAPDDNH